MIIFCTAQSYSTRDCAMTDLLRNLLKKCDSRVHSFKGSTIEGKTYSTNFDPNKCKGLWFAYLSLTSYCAALKESKICSRFLNIKAGTPKVDHFQEWFISELFKVVLGFRVLGFSALPGFRALKAGNGAWSVHKTLFGFRALLSQLLI